MQVSETWLREWVAPEVSTDELVAELSMAGLEVDSAEPAAPHFSGVVVGEVVATEPHPEADRLTVCTVSDGASEFTVVCGAANVRKGLKTPFARVGALLPDGTPIEHAELRGVKSAGMLCGADELGLSDERDGIMELPADLPAGASLREALDLDDTLIDIELTPNRGDCLGVRGLSREVGVLWSTPVKAPEIVPVEATVEDSFPVALGHAAGCPRYCGRVIRDVNIRAITPGWMVERLRRSGVRSIDPVVDVTNYVMLELGQPMHAFDLDVLQGGIDVRLARPGETLTLLDGRQIELQPDVLLITDESGPVALAGIMGGENSGIRAGNEDGGEQTRHIFLESAFFAPEQISGRARRYGLQTDASYRYERGVDFELAQIAIERATQLLLEIVGGQPGPTRETVSAGHLPQRTPILLRHARVERVLGMAIEARRISEILARLGFETTEDHDEARGVTWQVTPPSFRFDVAIEADLIEEVARVHGYNNVDVRQPRASLHLLPTEESRVAPGAVRETLAGAGFTEVLNYAFVTPDLQARLVPDVPVAALANPLSEDLSVMRTSLWPGLVRTWVQNRNRQQPRARIFEIGRVFAGTDSGAPEESVRVGLLLAGRRNEESWARKAQSVDFHDLRAAVERLVELTGDREAFVVRPAEHPTLHPGQAAALDRIDETGRREVGVFGAMHPRLQQELDLGGTVFVAELDFEVLAGRLRPRHSAISRLPSVRRDLALEVPETVAADDVLATTRKAGGALLTDVRLFDVYQGDGVTPGHRSLAIALQLQSADRTLQDEEVQAVMQDVVDALSSLGAVQR